MSLPVATDVIIVNYHSAGDTLGAVAALRGWERGHVWVVDNSEDEQEAATLRRSLANHPSATLIVSPRNLGFGEACNLAYAQSKAAFVLLLNPDARIAPEELALLVGVLEGTPGLGAVVPRIFWDEEARFLLPTLGSQLPFTWFMNALATRSPSRIGHAWSLLRIRRQRALHSATGAQPLKFVSGAVLLLRRADIERIGKLFDPAFFMFYEDADLSRRLTAAGIGMALVPEAHAFHHWKQKPEKGAPMQQSAPLYMQRHFPKLDRISRRWGAAPGDPFGPLASPRPAQTYAAESTGPVCTLEQFEAALGDRRIAAICPSLIGYPAIFRPSGALSVNLSAQDWNRLCPGFYLLLVHAAHGSLQRLILEKAEVT